MADRKFIESLKIEDNIFELKESCIIGYLSHYSAPYTGGGEYNIPAGTKFCLSGPMRDDAMYMHIIEENNSNLFELLSEIEKKRKREKENSPIKYTSIRILFLYHRRTTC